MFTSVSQIYFIQPVKLSMTLPCSNVMNTIFEKFCLKRKVGNNCAQNTELVDGSLFFKNNILFKLH